VLYVALTRAVKSLYIISEKKTDSKTKAPNTDYYSGLFIQYLMNKGLWNEEQQRYNFGKLPDADTAATEKNAEQRNIPFKYSYKERSSFKILAKSGMLWDTNIEAALLKGNTIHTILSLIHTLDDVNPCFEKLIQKGELNQEEASSLKQKILAIIQHPQLEEFYTANKIIKNEKDIIDKNGIILRPDRLVFEGKKATIIDYKTGKRNISYKDQIDSYALALEAMDFQIKNKIIVYIGNDITPEFI
jgi:ATP-dependent exoDNAse (exonuclease V) beta subunit